MEPKTYKKIEIVGTSTQSVSDAIDNAIRRAAETVKNTDWFEVVETRGRIDDGKVGEYQVTLKVGFRID